MGGINLTRTEINPYLGVEIASTLDWSTQIDKICGKANKILGLLRRNLHHVPRNIKEQSYKSMVRPILEYSSAVWSPWQERNNQKLEAVQKKAARFVLNRPPSRDYTSITQLIKDDLKWKTLMERRDSNRVVILYNILTGSLKVPVSYFPQQSTIDTRIGSHFIQYQTLVNPYTFPSSQQQSPYGTTCQQL